MLRYKYFTYLFFNYIDRESLGSGDGVDQRW
jgi:hypothetical protein